MTQNKPKVIASWYLTLFDQISCYNLDNWKRVFRLSDLTLALRGKKHGKFANYLSPQNIRKHLKESLWPNLQNDRQAMGITIAELDWKEIKTYDSEDFMEICWAFIDASYDSELSDAQIEIVNRARAFVKATSKIGITWLIDEATGFQYIRWDSELQIKFSYMLSEELRPWEKLFPDEFWQELWRLTNWTNLKKRPKYWWKLVNEFVYEALDKDIAEYLQENKPPKITWQKYHQWLNENQWIKKLSEHLWQLIWLAKTCENIDDLRYEVNKHYSWDIFQPKLFENRRRWV